jgi:hypothetical protein
MLSDMTALYIPDCAPPPLKRFPRKREWSVEVLRPPEAIFDPSVALKSKQPECVRVSRCRRAAVRQGKQLHRHTRTGLWLLDGDAGLCLDEVEDLLLGSGSDRSA